MTRPTTLIEDWLPFDAIGAESLRERGASSALPALYFLHVWWARRPLTVSRAAVVASLLPSWPELQARAGPGHPLRKQFPTEDAYHAWFLRLMGIYGDPVAGRKLIQWARERNVTLKGGPYGGAPRAFTVNPAPGDLALLGDLLALTWGGSGDLSGYTLLDPFAGGGSIPFEGRRYGLSVVANELNPVAAVILTATLDYPARFGPDLASDIRKWGQEWSRRVEKKLAVFFPKQAGESIFAYLWARTVACPVTGRPLPLSPNWWLSRDPPAAVRVLADPAWEEPRFEIVRGAAIDFDPDEGTISRGVGRSPWTGDAVDGDYIKAEAQAGRMGQVLYAVAVKRRGGFDFRAPTADDLRAARQAEEAYESNLPRWEAAGLVPDEPRQAGRADWAAEIYGLRTWATSFSPRQLLSLITCVETLKELDREIRGAMDEERARAVGTYLAFALSKATNYNSNLASWNAPRAVIRSVFDRHDFSFKWTFAEFDSASNLLPWGTDQVYDAYKGIAELNSSIQATLEGHASGQGALSIINGSAISLSGLADRSVLTIVTDPPYYDNVMYAELSDFFYVWLKRTVGDVYPGWFATQLTDKDAEAVVNVARFADLGGNKVELAERDYERKMEAAFREMHRVLADDGVLTVMFTHKRVEAWDTLATALINAGFCVQTSWPVHTESEHSLHQAQKNAAQSTILLACRKRQAAARGAEPTWWDDVASRVRQVARDKAAEFAARGIGGVDLYLSTFGPVLAVISEHWPVLTREVDERTGQPRPLRPETALDLARQEVIALRKRGLLLGREVRFDDVTDWYLMAWDAFKAEQFPADEARKLALALGLDVERDLVARRVLAKKGSDVALLRPTQRRGRGKADPEAQSFDTWLDAVHTALLVYDEDGAAACQTLLIRAGLRTDSTFKACLQAMINAVPRAKSRGNFVRPEADLLDRLRAAFFEDLAVPADEQAPPRVEQMGLFEK